jgi:hypothetical protein
VPHFGGSMFSRRRPCLAWSGHGGQDHFLWRIECYFQEFSREMRESGSLVE